MRHPLAESILGASLILMPLKAGAQDVVWSVGVNTQDIVDFEPGHDWMWGPEIGFSHQQIFSHRLEFQTQYLTSRLEAAYRNILREDWFVFSPIWHFRRDRLFNPTLQADFGYNRYDTEFDWARSLDNSTWFYGAKAGLRLNFFESRYNLHFAFGYQQALSESNVVYALPFSFGISHLFL